MGQNYGVPPPSQNYGQTASNPPLGQNYGVPPTSQIHGQTSSNPPLGQTYGSPPNTAAGQPGHQTLGQNSSFPQPNQTTTQFSNTLAPQNAGHASGYPSQLATNSGVAVVMNMNSPEIPYFDGTTEKYVDFKTIFGILTEPYPENIKAPLLRTHLDSNSQRRVMHVSLDEPNALQKMWNILDQKHDQQYQGPTFHVTSLLGLLGRSPCTNLTELQELHDILIYHYSRACKAGPEYVGQAEAVKTGISSILFGSSRKRVNQLRSPTSKAPFNMSTIFRYISEHIQELEGDEMSKKAAGVIRYGDKYKPDYHASRESRSRERFSHSPNRSPKQNFSRSHNHSKSPMNFHVNQASTSFEKQNYANKQSGKHRSPTPFSRNKSPSARNASPRGRRKESYRCILCQADDHEGFKCKRLNPDEQVKICRESGICFKCLMPGHISTYCPFPNYCIDPTCNTKIQHNTMFCSHFKNQK